MGDFFSYLSWLNIVLLAVALMSGILSIIREGILIYNPTKIDQKRIFWGCMRIAFIISALLLWGLEHQALIKSKHLYEETTVPDLRSEIDASITGQIATTLKDGTKRLGPIGILLYVNIRDLGADSIAEGYKLAVYDPQGILIGEGSLQLLPEDFNVGSLKISNEDMLTAKSEETPIPKGGAKKGYLFFVINVPNAAAIQQLGTRFVVTFNDVTGKSYSVDCVVSPRTLRSMPMWYPGTSLPEQRSRK